MVSLTNHTAEDQPLLLFEGQEKSVIHSEIEATRARVAERLPFYMVPTVWIAVSSLPLLSSRKLDRKLTATWLNDMSDEVYQRAIPAAEGPSTLEQASSPLEATLRTIWAHVLNLPEEQIALNRAFLSLGGDSISAMQVMGQCRKQGFSVGVQEILRSRSISELATVVKDDQPLAIDVTEEIDVPFDLTPIQRLWFQLPNQGHGHFNQSFYLKVQRKTTPMEFRAAVETLVARHCK